MAFSNFVTTTATTISALTPPEMPVFQTPAAGADWVTLRWNAPAGATGYVVEFRTETGEWGDVYAGGATQMTLSGLTPETVYEFRAKATNTAGESGWATLTVQTKVYENFIRMIRLTSGTAFVPEREGFITGG